MDALATDWLNEPTYIRLIHEITDKTENQHQMKFYLLALDITMSRQHFYWKFVKPK